ncbi:MAG: hypothetical protein ABI457_09020 [Hyphomicrobium sp.]|jgi:hypothetical protein
MRLLTVSLAAMTASTACLGMLFLYALFVPTLPAPAAALTGVHVSKWSTPVQQPLVTAAVDIR